MVQIDRYITGARAREQRRLDHLRQRQEIAFRVARQAAQILKEQFGATRVVLFGSLLEGGFHEISDIDLAVWDLPENQYFKAVSRLISLSDIKFDIVEYQYADLEMVAVIAQGIEL